ncbi:MAG TPA: type I-U CRISPR-associated RAMP protein Csb1/Cas7u [Gemmata sp.]
MNHFTHPNHPLWDSHKVPCVLLDSVPSQANRMEFALQDAINGGEFELPVVSVNFAAVDNPGVPKITSLQAPHRIADAILRDSTIGEGKKTKFRESDIGKELDRLSSNFATPLLQYAALPCIRHVGQHRAARWAGREVRSRAGVRDHRCERGRRSEDEQPHRPT